jgi:hypothetical protein
VIKHHTMKSCRGMEVKRHVFLICHSLEKSVMLQPLQLQGKVPSTHWQEPQVHWRYSREGAVHKLFPCWYVIVVQEVLMNWAYILNCANTKFWWGNLLYSSCWETRFIKEDNIKIDLNEIASLSLYTFVPPDSASSGSDPEPARNSEDVAYHWCQPKQCY